MKLGFVSDTHDNVPMVKRAVEVFNRENVDGEKKILSGHYFETLDALISSQLFFLIIYGHTHRPEVRKVGGTLIVNPGECGGWVYGKSTVAVCDLENQAAEIVEL